MTAHDTREPNCAGRWDSVEQHLPAAAELAVAVSERDKEAVAAVLEPMTRQDLYALAIALAANVDLDAPLTTEAAAPGFIINRAIALSAQVFQTSREAIVSPSRVRNVVDARTTAMYAARLCGLSSPYVGAAFNKDHSTVLHACGRVGENPRLRAIGQRIAGQCGWVRDEQEVAS